MCLNPLTIIVKPKDGIPYRQEVSCGKCVECKMKYSNDWALRCMLEASKHKATSFISLTYNEDNLPVGASLRKRDFQLFMKRLRKEINASAKIKIRFFGCGEYGSLHDRPHYHIIIFGFDFPDKYYFKTDNKGNKLYRSPLLEKCWKYGFSSIGELSFDTAKYCAKYMCVDVETNDGREKPFVLMSRRPGLALDIIPDTVYQDGVLYFQGKRVTAPKAFLRVVRKDFPNMYELIKYKRSSFADQLYYRNCQIINGVEFWSDDSIYYLFQDLKKKEFEQKQIDLENRRKKIKKIFGKCIDNFFRPVLSFKKLKSMSKRH